MEIRVLKYFLAVASEKNITKAAKLLHITQPTLSRQLIQLEEELNTTLFIRGKNNITLTDDGILLRSRAQEIIDLTKRTEKELLDNDMIVGEIFIGAGETYAMHILSRTIKSFNKLYPNVKYNLFSGNADDIKEKIDKGLIDFGLLMQPVDIEKYEFLHIPYSEKWGIIARKDSPLAKNKYITPDDLLNKPLLTSQRTIVQNEIANWFQETYEKLNIIATYNLIYNAKIMVEEGLGYAITVEKLVEDDKNICFIPFFPNLVSGNVLVWKKDHALSPTINSFIKILKEELMLEKNNAF